MLAAKETEKLYLLQADKEDIRQDKTCIKPNLKTHSKEVSQYVDGNNIVL